MRVIKLSTCAAFCDLESDDNTQAISSKRIVLPHRSGHKILIQAAQAPFFQKNKDASTDRILKWVYGIFKFYQRRHLTFSD
jgi:hypothetical protein